MKKNVEIKNELNIIVNLEVMDKIDNILNEYIYKIERIQNNMKIEDMIGTVYVYAEIYEYLVDKEKWNHIIKSQFIKLKECIEEEELLNGMALFGGLCEVGLAVYLYSQKTGHYIHFWRSGWNDKSIKAGRLCIRFSGTD